MKDGNKTSISTEVFPSNFIFSLLNIKVILYF